MQKKLILMASLIICCGLAIAQHEDFSKVRIKVTKVSGNVYMLEGAGGNIGALVGPDGVVIVDDQFAPLVDRIRVALKGITDKPVRFVINTHWHIDHSGGNEPFSKTSTIIAQENVRKRLASGGVAGNAGSLHFEEEPAPPAALPVITFQQNVTVHLNGENVRALHYPNGHTDGDSVILFEKANVVHMGDDFVTYGFPFIDIDSGGSVKGLSAAMEKLLRELPPDVTVIPGHGPICSLGDVRRYTKMLKETTAVVEKALAEGKTLEQMKQEKILEPWKSYNGDFISTDAFLETLFNSLTGKKNVGFLKHN